MWDRWWDSTRTDSYNFCNHIYLLEYCGGEGGIRTHVPVTRQDAFEAPPLRPLRYLSLRPTCWKRTLNYTARKVGLKSHAVRLKPDTTYRKAKCHRDERGFYKCGAFGGGGRVRLQADVAFFHRLLRRTLGAA
jgi:hypothetical protein